MEEVSSNIIIAVIINKYLVCHEVNKYKVGVKKSIQYGCFSPKLLEHKHFIIPFLYILSHFFFHHGHGWRWVPYGENKWFSHDDLW